MGDGVPCYGALEIVGLLFIIIIIIRGYGAPGGRKLPFSIDLRNGPYNSVRTNVLHCD